MVNNKLNAIQRLIKCKFIEIIHKINENILESEKDEKGSSRLYIVSYRIERGRMASLIRKFWVLIKIMKFSLFVAAIL